MTELTQPVFTPGGSPSSTRPPAGRPRWLGPVRIISAVVAALVLATVALGVVSGFFERRESETRAFGGNVTRVRVDTDTGDVDVVVGVAGEAVRVTSERTVSFGSAEVSADVSGDVLDVQGLCSRRRPALFDHCSVDLEIRVPPGVALDLASDTGNVEVTGAAGAVTAASDTGDVTINGVRGVVDLQSDTGDIDGVALATATVRADTDTGNVTLQFLTEPQTVTAESDTGNVTVAVPNPTTSYRVVPETDTGETQIDVPSSPASARVITVTSATGDVRVVPESPDAPDGG